VRSLLALSHTGGLGGAERALLELLLALQGAGWEAHCVVPAPGEMAAALERRGIGVSVVPSQGWATSRTTPGAVASGSASNLQVIPQTLLAVPRLVSILRRVRPDVVVSNTITSPLGALTAKAVRLPHVVYAHEYGVADHGMLFFLGFDRSMRILSRLSPVFLANSQATSTFFSAALSRPVAVVPYAMSLAPRRHDPLPARPPELRALVLGRVTEAKNQLECVRAVAAARASETPVRLRLVGSGDEGYRQRLLAEAASLGIAEVVEHQGHVEDASVEYDAAHVVIVPSRREAFGRVTVEAMLRSRPVIAAASGASTELVQPGRSGLLYEPGRPRSLADALTTMWAGWDDARAWSQHAYEVATTSFTEEQTVAAFERAVPGG
jgi:glycosyltransferase involved in cell wall biosynthesis